MGTEKKKGFETGNFIFHLISFFFIFHVQVRHYTVYLAFQLMASMKYRLVIMDVSSASGTRDHCSRLCPRLASGQPDQSDDGLIWREDGETRTVTLGYLESTFDLCLYYLPFAAEENPNNHRRFAGLVLLDVDDFVQGGNAQHCELMEQLRTKFKFGKLRDIYGS